MLTAFKGDVSAFQEYMMIDRKVYQEMGKINADAIQGLQPKMSVWTTGGAGDGYGSAGGGAGQSIADIYRMIPPLLTTIKEQTGIGHTEMPTINIIPGQPPMMTKNSK